MSNIFTHITSAARRITSPESPTAATLINNLNAPASPSVVAIPTRNADSVDGHASEQASVAVAHDLHCTLTIGEAQALFTTHLRRPLSQRSLQRYCANGTIAAQLISHSQGKEWLLNETSLLRFIEKYPITLTEHPSATVPAPAPTPEPKHVGAVAPIAPQPTPTAPPVRDKHQDIGDASDDSDDFVDPSETGEPRRLGEILIENARLTALLEGNTALIEQLKQHDARTHDDFVHSRELVTKLTDDVRDINSQMLDTMLKMSKGSQALLSSDDETTTAATRRR